MKIKHLFQLFLFISVLVSMSAHSNTPADDELSIDSATQNLDFKKDTLYFAGNVTVTKGAMTIQADELFVKTKDGVGEKLTAKGSPASFSQNDKLNGKLTATAEQVIYLVQEQKLKLIGNAKFQQGSSEVVSGNIEFDLNAQKVKADGDQSTRGRVTTTIKTKKSSADDN